MVPGVSRALVRGPMSSEAPGPATRPDAPDLRGGGTVRGPLARYRVGIELADASTSRPGSTGQTGT